MPIEKVGVVGCGRMGSGIAHVAALAGFDTVVREVSSELVAKGLQSIEKNLQRQADKGTITAALRDETRARRCGSKWVTSTPANPMRPPVAGKNPISALSRVVLPMPL